MTSEADKVRAVIGLTGQAAAVDELLTGRENLVMMGQLYRLTAASARVRGAGAALVLPGRAHHWPRSALAPGHVGDHQEPARGRHHHLADRPVPRRGRPVGRPDSSDRRRKGDRRGTPSALKSKVGNDRLELTFRDAESFQRAVIALGDEGHRPPRRPRVLYSGQEMAAIGRTLNP